jgi:glucose-6-phosphate 1-epimerase
MPHLNAKLANSQFIHLSDTQTLFNGQDALPVLVINAPFCQATIALQGAQLLQFQPTGDKPWLWLSPYAHFEKGHAIRGGIPICLPWFGVNQQTPSKPKHGFVRTIEWQLDKAEESAEHIRLNFSYVYSGDKPELFETAFKAYLIIELSQQLTLTLNIENNAAVDAPFSWAMHTYFAVDDCAQAQVSGLDGATYLDNTQALQATTQQGNVMFLEEVDRVFQSTTDAQYLHTHHQLEITGNDCPSCIIWNPGKSAANSLSDIKESYKAFVCVERGCAFIDSLSLPANSQYISNMTIHKIT